MARLKSEDFLLFHEDCISGMFRRLKPKSIDIVVTSPPYNIGVKYGTYNDKSPAGISGVDCPMGRCG